MPIGTKNGALLVQDGSIRDGCCCGACCIGGTSSCVVTSKSGCDQLLGTFRGAGTTCSPNPCLSCFDSRCWFDAFSFTAGFKQSLALTISSITPSSVVRVSHLNETIDFTSLQTTFVLNYNANLSVNNSWPTYFYRGLDVLTGGSPSPCTRCTTIEAIWIPNAEFPPCVGVVRFIRFSLWVSWPSPDPRDPFFRPVSPVAQLGGLFGSQNQFTSQPLGICDTEAQSTLPVLSGQTGASLQFGGPTEVFVNGVYTIVPDYRVTASITL